MKKIKILDTTLRDGSYATNFSFTQEETSNICAELQKANVEFIEIGHGVGFRGSEKGFGHAKHTDEEYLKAAKSVLSKSKFGMFCIPGIAKLDDIDLARKYEMDFIRIGTDVTKISESKEFIKKAKDSGMLVTANYMKSYAVSPKTFAKKVVLSEGYGADIVYVVDSAGGMFGNDLENYYDEIRKITSIPLGFHGHDNLGLSISNSILAAELGFEIIDSSLQGLGRSSGNASTEVLIAALTKKNFSTGINFRKILEIGIKNIQSYASRGRMPLDIVAGLTDFHSSYMPHIEKISKKFNVDPISLMIEITKIDKVDLDLKNLENIATKLPSINASLGEEFNFDRYVGGEQDEQKY
jgi:4-hydroxy 2-oxovalerate aldolase